MYIDFVFLFFAFTFIMYAKTARIVFTILIFYGVRAVFQAWFLFQFPQHMIFDDPGYPSLMVPYGVTSDFYFSGHCGFLLIICLEMYHEGYKKLVLLHCFMLTFMATLLIFTRGHYSIGIFSS